MHDSQPPEPAASATSQSGTCASPPWPRSWRTASMIRKMPRMPGWHDESPPPSVLSGHLPAALEVALGDERAALALGHEAEALEQDQAGDREAVVEHQQVDVVVRDARPRERLGSGLRARATT